MAFNKYLAVLLALTVFTAHQVKGFNVIAYIYLIFVEHPESELCQVDCVKKIYEEYCGGAQCVYGVTTEDELDSLCSATCYEAISGDVMIKCLEETKFEDTFDRDDARIILAGQINDFCATADDLINGGVGSIISPDDSDLDTVDSDDEVEDDVDHDDHDDHHDHDHD